MSPSRRRPSTPRGSNGETTEREQAARLQTATYRISEAANAAEHLPELFRAIHGIISELRSEEHTSELQSRSDLVCRLLLEKKKNLENIDCAVENENYCP